MRIVVPGRHEGPFDRPDRHRLPVRIRPHHLTQTRNSRKVHGASQGQRTTGRIPSLRPNLVGITDQTRMLEHVAEHLRKHVAESDNKFDVHGYPFSGQLRWDGPRLSGRGCYAVSLSSSAAWSSGLSGLSGLSNQASSLVAASRLPVSAIST